MSRASILNPTMQHHFLILMTVSVLLLIYPANFLHANNLTDIKPELNATSNVLLEIQVNRHLGEAHRVQINRIFDDIFAAAGLKQISKTNARQYIGVKLRIGGNSIVANYGPNVSKEFSFLNNTTHHSGAEIGAELTIITLSGTQFARLISARKDPPKTITRKYDTALSAPYEYLIKRELKKELYLIFSELYGTDFLIRLSKRHHGPLDLTAAAILKDILSGSGLSPLHNAIKKGDITLKSGAISLLKHFIQQDGSFKQCVKQNTKLISSIKQLGKLENEKLGAAINDILNLLEIDLGIAKIEKDLRNPDFRIRMSALQALKSKPDETAYDYLFNALDDFHPRVRLIAVSQIGLRPKKYGEKPLINLLKKERSGDVVISIVDILGKWKSTFAVEEISKILNFKVSTASSSSHLTRTCLDALANIDNDAAADALLTFCRKTQAKDVHCFIYLSRIRHKQTIDFLIDDLANSKENSIKRLIIPGHLESMTKQHFGKDIEKWRQWWKENRETYQAN